MGNKPKRVVLGVGYFWQTEKYECRLLPKKYDNCIMADKCKNIRVPKYLHDKKVRIIAEIINDK